jgi:hypothetical protein
MFKKQLLLTFFLFLFLTSCVSDEQKAVTQKDESQALKTAYFVDSAVEGIDYYFYDKLQGTTDKDGTFQYLDNTDITFKLGNLTLGTIAASNIEENDKVFPQDIVGVDRRYTLEDSVMKIALLLQSLDSDDNPDNGITIDQSIRTQFKNIDQSNIQDINSTDLDQIIQASNKTALLEDKVLTHLNKNTIEVEQLKGRETISKPLLKDISVSIDETPSNDPSITRDIITRVPMITNGTLPIQSFTLEGEGSQNFDIDNKGYIRLKSNIKLDYEKTPVYNLSAQAKNMLGSSKSVNITINLNNLNDEVPDIRDTVIVAKADYETKTEKTVLGKVNLKLEGDSQITSYEIVEQDLNQTTDLNAFEQSFINQKFEITTDGTVYLKEGEILDYSEGVIYNLQIKATNKAGESEVKNIVIQEGEQFTTFLENTTLSIKETHEQGTSIGKINMLENTVIDSIKLLGEGNFLFDIQKDGTLILKEDAVLNYEQKRSYKPVVYAIDSLGNVSSAILTINILDIDFKPPTINDLVTYLNENSPKGVIVGNIEIVSTGDTPIESFTLIDHADSNDSRKFQIDEYGSLRLKEDTIDYETKRKYTFQAFCTNAFGNSNIVDVTINVKNQSDVFPILNDFNKTIPENAAKGYVVGKIDVKDWRSADKFLYVHMNDTSLFNVDTSGIITVKEDNQFDYESGNIKFEYYAYALTEFDNTNTIDVTINISNVPDIPPILKTATFEVSDTAKKGTVIGQVEIADMKEASSIISMRLNDESIFSVDKNGFITLIKEDVLDRNKQNKHVYQVYAMSDIVESAPSNIQIDLISTPTIADFTAILGEDITDYIPNYKFPPISIIDNGGKEVTSYTLSNNKEFDIDDNGRIFVKTGITFDYDIKNQYKLTVYATNAAGISNIADVTIDIVEGFSLKSKAQLGLLADAKVEVFQLQKNGAIFPVYETVTSNDGTYEGSGNFELYTINENDYYVAQISGGVDLDSNSDGIIEPAVPNKGIIRAIYKGAWIKDMNIFRITGLSEILYSQVVQYYKYGFTDLEFTNYIQNKLEGIFKEDINLDGVIDYLDLFNYEPYKFLNNTKITQYVYQNTVDNIHKGYQFEAVNGPRLLGKVTAGYSYSVHIKDENTVLHYDREMGKFEVDVSNSLRPTQESGSAPKEHNALSTQVVDDYVYSFLTGGGISVARSNNINTILDTYQYQRSIDSTIMNLSDDSREIIIVTHNEITAGIMDISNPKKIILKGEMPHVQYMHDIVSHPSKSYLYLADGYYGFKILDSSILNQSQFSGYYSMNRNINYEDIHISYSRIYLENTEKYKIDIYDILSDFDREEYLTSISFYEHLLGLIASNNDEKLYVISHNGNMKLHVYDVKNKDTIEALSSIDISNNDNSDIYKLIVSKDNSTLYALTEKNIYFVDIRDDLNLISSSFNSSNADFENMDFFISPDMETMVLLKKSEKTTKMIMFDIKDIHNIQAITQHEFKFTIYDTKIAFDSNKIFMNTSDGIKIYDFDFKKLGSYMPLVWAAFPSGSNFNKFFVTNRGKDIYYIHKNKDFDLELIKLDASDPANINENGEKIFLIPSHQTKLRFFGDSLNHSDRLRDRFYMIKNNIIYSYDLDMLKPLPDFID